MIITVVTFEPSDGSPCGVGGYDWCWDRQAAIRLLKERIGADDADGGMGYDYAMKDIRLPDDIQKIEDIDAFVDSFVLEGR